MTDHEFGGEHTELKLEVIGSYLQRFNTVLKNQNFERVYIDAFAGAGKRLAAKSNDLFGETRQLLPGSAEIAIQTEPPFHKLVFIDQKKKHVEALRELAKEHLDREIDCRHGDCNQILPDVLRAINWRNHRAVLFLDPYGMNVDWTTLGEISSFKGIDLWYLFPTFGMLRQAPRNPEKIDDIKARSLTRLLGTDDWREALYETSSEPDLFGIYHENRLSIPAIDSFVHNRLKEIFPSVLKPAPIFDKHGRQIFSLYFALTNDSKKAMAVAKPIADYILTPLRQGTRPRSGL